MASKGASARAAARKQKDKWKSKRWYKIRAPRQPWHFKQIGETIAEDDELLIGRMYEITQQEVDGDFSKMNVKLKFRVTEIVGQDAITEFAGHEVLKDHVRRQIRRYRGKVDDVIDAVTDDGYYIRIKPLLITQQRCKTSKKQAIRQSVKELILQTAASSTWMQVQKKLLDGTMQEEVESVAGKIVSIREVILRKSQLVQTGIVADDGPTLEEIQQDEDRVSAAKEAAIAAAMDGEEVEEGEDDTPDLLAAEVQEVAKGSDDESDNSSDDEVAEVEEAVEEVVEEAPEAASEDLSSLTVAVLKERLKEAGLPVSGKKADLVARLSE